MTNNISITVRLPQGISNELKILAKDLGMTRTNLLRMSIHDFLAKNETTLTFADIDTAKRDRLVLNVNQFTFDILDAACKKHQQSMNSIINAVSLLALERYTKWLQPPEM
jgi:hypothetical protein